MRISESLNKVDTPYTSTLNFKENTVTKMTKKEDATIDASIVKEALKLMKKENPKLKNVEIANELGISSAAIGLLLKDQSTIKKANAEKFKNIYPDYYKKGKVIAAKKTKGKANKVLKDSLSSDDILQLINKREKFLELDFTIQVRDVFHKMFYESTLQDSPWRKAGMTERDFFGQYFEGNNPENKARAFAKGEKTGGKRTKINITILREYCRKIPQFAENIKPILKKALLSVKKDPLSNKQKLDILIEQTKSFQKLENLSTVYFIDVLMGQIDGMNKNQIKSFLQKKRSEIFESFK